jgi:vanillate O-demethylase ferredoxin subunit
VTALTVRIAHKTFETPLIARLELVAAEGQRLPAFSAGAHIDVHTPGGPVRQYSLCNDPAETHRYVIGVLRDAASRGGSVALCDRTEVGQVLQISAPRNHFPLDETAPHSLLLAGGIGITPLLCMAERLHRLGASFELHHCVRSRSQAAFFERIEASGYAGAVHLHCDDGAQAQSLQLARLYAQAPAGTHLYTCGPGGFMTAVLDAAQAAGWDQSRLHSEFFAPLATPAGAPKPKAGQAFELVLARSGRVLQVPAGVSAADVLIEAGIDLEISCEQGVCGACLTRVIDGIPEHRDMLLSKAERAANDQFTPCCSRACSPRLVVDL